MTVAELQKYLSDFNPNAKIEVVVENCPKPFDLAFGSSEGCTKRTADNVAFMVGGTNETVQCQRCEGTGKLIYAFGNFSLPQKHKEQEGNCYMCGGTGLNNLD